MGCVSDEEKPPRTEAGGNSMLQRIAGRPRDAGDPRAQSSVVQQRPQIGELNGRPRLAIRRMVVQRWSRHE